MELTIIITILKQSKTLHNIAWGIFLITEVNVSFLASRQFILVISMIAFLLLLMQCYYALRLALDYDFFKILQAQTPEVENLQQLDQILYKFKLMKTISNERSLEHRILGTMALFKMQLISLVLQAVLYVAALLILLIL